MGDRSQHTGSRQTYALAALFAVIPALVNAQPIDTAATAAAADSGISMPTTSATSLEITNPVVGTEDASTALDGNDDQEIAAQDDGLGDFSDFADIDLLSLLDADVESASNNKASISQSPAIIEIITQDHIKNWGSTNLEEILEHVVGIEYSVGYLGIPNMSFRGPLRDNWDNRALLLVDGYPAFEPGNGGMLHDLVPLAAIDRIEVIRGPAGVMFGTNAFSGVINIFTKEPNETGVDASVAGGYSAHSEVINASTPGDQRWTGLARGTGQYVFERGYLRISADANRSPRWTSGGNQVIGDTGYQPWAYQSGITQGAVNARLVIQEGNHKIDIQNGAVLTKRLRWGIQPLAGIDNEAYTRAATFSYIRYDFKKDNWSVWARTGYSNYDLDAPSGKFPFPENNDLEIAGRSGEDREIIYKISSGKWDSDLRIGYDFGRVQLTAGANASAHIYRRYSLYFDQGNGEIGEQFPTLPLLDYRKPAFDANLMAEATYSPVDNLILVAGARLSLYDAPKIRSDLDNPSPLFTPNPRAALIWTISEPITVKLLYGRAFRLPSLFELFANAFGIIEPNINLQPETIDTYEIALDTRPVEAMSLRVNAFVNRIRNEILNLPVGGNTTAIYHDNGAGSLYWGAETMIRYVAEHWDVRVSYGYLEGRDDWTFDSAGIRNGKFARHRIVAGLTNYWFDKKLSISPTYRMISPRESFDYANIIDLSTFYRLTDAIEIGATATNLTNQRFRTSERTQNASLDGTYMNKPLTGMLWLNATF